MYKNINNENSETIKSKFSGNHSSAQDVGSYHKSIINDFVVYISILLIIKNFINSNSSIAKGAKDLVTIVFLYWQ